jgi:hypothetical protein
MAQEIGQGEPDGVGAECWRHGMTWGYDGYLLGFWNIFYIIYGIILPIDYYCSEGLKPPTSTNQICG